MIWIAASKARAAGLAKKKCWQDVQTELGVIVITICHMLHLTYWAPL